MSAGSLRGIRPGARVERVYFEVKHGDLVVPVETFDEAVERGERLRAEHAQFITRLSRIGAPGEVSGPSMQRHLAPVLIIMRWVIANTDGVTVDVIIDTFDLDGE